MKRPKTAHINGRRVKLDIWTKYFGWATPVTTRNQPSQIVIPDGMDDSVEKLDTLIHEFLHASDWSASEEKVARTATDLTRLLNRIYKFRLRKFHD